MEVKRDELDEAYKKSLAAVNEWGWRRVIRAMYLAVRTNTHPSAIVPHNASNANCGDCGKETE